MMAPAVLDRPKAKTDAPAKMKHGDDPLFEVVKGQRVELENMSSYSNQLATDLVIALANYAREKNLGTALSEALVSIPVKHDADNQRRPDVAYLSKERWPLSRRAPDTDPWPAVPNLAVEVLSPNDRIQEVTDKIHEYFEAGVELVWVVNPRRETVSVYTSAQQVTILGKSDTLTAGEVIPGFALPLGQLFRT
ncbi:MAG: Uma2 family endonuclease [Gemmatales bacterium]